MLEKDPYADHLKLDFIKVHQPIGEFYIAKMSHTDLISICYADIREIEKEGDFESYLGIQRELDPKRIKELKTYVGLSDSSFPTSVILSITNRKYYGSEYEPFNKPVDEIFDNIEYLDQKFKLVENILIKAYDGKEKLVIRRDDRVAKIIDGQHRIEGLKYYTGEDPYEMNVTIFQDLDIEDQAILFATINKAQTKVNKSRVYDLYDLAKSRSPLKTCHNIAKFLNKKEGSPFIDKIKILGKANDTKETITQATFVESLVPYISKFPVIDRDIIRRGGKLVPVYGNELVRHFFRNLFIEEKDSLIARNIFNYFNAVKATWSIAWDTNEVGYILNKSAGFVAFCRFYRDVYLKLCKLPNSTEIDIEKIGTVFSFEQYKAIIDPISNNITDDDFTTENYDPGGSGRSQLYNDLVLYSDV